MNVACRDEYARLLKGSEADVRALIGSLVRDPQVREDIFQETALACWEAFDRYDRERSFAAWARGVAAKKVLQELHRTGRRPSVLSPESVQAVLDAFDRTEERASLRLEALRRCVEALPARSREMLALRYEESLRPEEMARRLGSSPAAVYKSLSRIRASLERCIERRLETEEHAHGREDARAGSRVS